MAGITSTGSKNSADSFNNWEEFQDYVETSQTIIPRGYCLELEGEEREGEDKWKSVSKTFQILRRTPHVAVAVVYTGEPSAEMREFGTANYEYYHIMASGRFFPLQGNLAPVFRNITRVTRLGTAQDRQAVIAELNKVIPVNDLISIIVQYAAIPILGSKAGYCADPNRWNQCLLGNTKKTLASHSVNGEIRVPTFVEPRKPSKWEQLKNHFLRR
jgi:hypothetical protein